VLLSPDTVIGDRYCLTDCVGAGGMGEVWKAKDLNFESKYVAVKLLKEEQTLQEDARHRASILRLVEQAIRAGSATLDQIVRVIEEHLLGGRSDPALRSQAGSELGDGPFALDGIAAFFDRVASDPSFNANEALRRRLRTLFHREANALANLRHHNIVGVSNYGHYGGLPFLVMDYIEGRTLSRVIQGNEPVSRPQRLQLIEELCAGLGYAHRSGIVHRDIKPANLIIDNTDGSLKILDFGVMRRLHGGANSTVGGVVGTWYYMSPEQTRGDPTLDERSDIFSVGAVFYELLTLRMAFPKGDSVPELVERIQRHSSEPVRTFVPDIEPAVEAIVEKALQKERGARYQRLADMQRDIGRVRAQLEKSDPAVRTVPDGDERRDLHQAEREAHGARGREERQAAEREADRQRAEREAQEAERRVAEAAAREAEERERRNAAERAAKAAAEAREQESRLAAEREAARLRDQREALEAERRAAEVAAREAQEGERRAEAERAAARARAQGAAEQEAERRGAEAVLQSAREREQREAAERAAAAKAALEAPNEEARIAATREAARLRASEQAQKQVRRLTAEVSPEQRPPAEPGPSKLRRAFRGTMAFGLLGLVVLVMLAPWRWGASDTSGDKPPQQQVTQPSTVRSVDRTASPSAVPAPLGIVSPAQAPIRWVSIRGGSFEMGCTVSEAGCRSSERPRHRVPVAGFRIMETEVTVAMVGAYLSARGMALPAGLKESAPNIPAVGLSERVAEEFCESIGARLPHETEWEFAARAGTSTAFWWGDQWDPERANGGGSPGPVAVGGRRAMNPWGLYDMLGNAAEWTSAINQPYPYSAETTGRSHQGDVLRVFRGGAWNQDPPSLRAAARQFLDQFATDEHVGFRCAQSIDEPVTRRPVASKWQGKWRMEMTTFSEAEACRRMTSEPELQQATLWECKDYVNWPGYPFRTAFKIRLGPSDERKALDAVRKRFLARGTMSVILRDENCSRLERQIHCSSSEP
jgi:serine/threonine protein kinase/formylglycine-generating enzyme required for sulfatase activity